jgi:hypothetical protein
LGAPGDLQCAQPAPISHCGLDGQRDDRMGGLQHEQFRKRASGRRALQPDQQYLDASGDHRCTQPARLSHRGLDGQRDDCLGSCCTSSAHNFADAARYNPATNAWTALPTVGAPTGRFLHTAVWTGRSMLIWGGAGYDLLGDGARYNPAAGTWSPLPVAGAPSPRTDHTAVVWPGHAMLIWGGAGSSGFLGDGAGYVPASTP